VGYYHSSASPTFAAKPDSGSNRTSIPALKRRAIFSRSAFADVENHFCSKAEPGSGGMKTAAYRLTDQEKSNAQDPSTFSVFNPAVHYTR
jgi:hypothetical protein